MQTVYKYSFRTTDDFILELPIGSKVLNVQMQGGIPCLWALVDTDSEKEEVLFEVYGTGHLLKAVEENKKRKYIGTYQEMGGALVWHLFVIKNK